MGKLIWIGRFLFVMNPWEFVGYRLLNDTSITAVVGQRIFHGIRPPMDVDLPCINFFQIDLGNDVVTETKGQVQNPRFQISCRAETAQGAMELGRLTGISFMNLKGSYNNFDIAFSEELPTGGLLPEEDGERFLYPVEIRFVYQDNTVS